MAMQIYESAEDYLETILMLEKQHGVVHSVAIAEDRGFSKASVSVAMKKLRENGYITMSKDGSIQLLEPGRKIAEKIYDRHEFFTNYFISIGVDPEIAQQDACRIEHGLSDETYEKMKANLQK